jgi:hypothetical protein
MGMKDFDYKQFLLERGERVGLYAAGGLGLLLIVLSLFWPGKGLFSASPKKSADEITRISKEKKDKAATATPSESEKKELRTVDPQLQKQASSVALDPNGVRIVTALFAPREIPSNKRQNPSVFGPEEFLTQFVQGQISTYLVNNERGEVFVAVLRNSGKKIANKAPKGNDFGKFFGGNASGGMKSPGPGAPGAPGAPGLPGGGGMFNPGQRNGQNPFAGSSGDKPAGGVFDQDKKNLEIVWIRKDELNNSNDPYARDLLPRRMLEVVGSFPLAAQIEEFRRSLHLENAAQVVQETLTTKSKSGKEGTVPGFGFLGLEVQRKTYGPDGQVILGPNGQEWQPLDFESPDSEYRALQTHVLFEAAPEDEKLAPLLWQGLYMPRPVQIPTRQAASKVYPDIESDLPKIKETLSEVAAKEPPPVNRTKFDTGGEFNPFGPQDNSAETPEQKPPSGAQDKWTPPSFSVLRFLDVTIQPGRTYEYQVQVKMQNPNFNKPESEVANPALSKPKELRSAWYPVKGSDGQLLRVRVPEEQHIYAVDVLAGKTSKDHQQYRARGGMNADGRADPRFQTVLQIQSWKDYFEYTSGSKTTQFSVGDWLVAERLIAYRGEYVGLKKVLTHVPVWSPERSEFYLAGPIRRRSGDPRPTQLVAFLDQRQAPLLVDFEGGKMEYHRGGGPAVPKTDEGTSQEGTSSEPAPASKSTPTTSVPAVAPTEVLFLTPEGKLAAHSNAEDAEDEERKVREEQYIHRVAEAEGKAEQPAAAKP